MKRLVCVVVFTGCHLYFEEPAPPVPVTPSVDAGGASVDAGAPSTSGRLALPCIQTVASGDILPDPGNELFVSYGCTGGPVIADVAYRSGELLALGQQADFQLRFQRAVLADLDGVPPSDILALDRYSSGWAFSRREFSGRRGNSFKFERPFADVVVTDLDGDHKRDLVVAGDDAIRMVGDAGSSSYGPVPLVIEPTMETELLTDRQFVALAAADLDGSAAKDLFFVAEHPSGGYELGVATQTSPLAFDVTSSSAPSGPLQRRMLVADVDGDGHDDIIGIAGRLFVRSSKHGTVALLSNPDVVAVDVGDLDGDGRAEPIAIVGDEVHRITVNAVGPALSLSSTLVLAEGGDELHVVALDGDAHDDLVLVRGIGDAASELVLHRGASL